MQIRLMQMAEVDAAIAAWEAAKVARGQAPDAARVARVREKLDEQACLTYVAVDGSVLGMALTEPARADDGRGPVLSKMLHISMVFVDPRAQRRGVGRSLVSHVFEAACAQGFRGASLWTAAGNIGATRLYESLGMRPTRTRQVSDSVQWIRYEATLHPERSLTR